MMNKKFSSKMNNALSLDATRTISKWLNEKHDTPIDRVALATVLARVGFLENEITGLKNAFEVMLGRTASIVERLQTAHYDLRQTNVVGNHVLNSCPTHYSSEPYKSEDEE